MSIGIDKGRERRRVKEREREKNLSRFSFGNASKPKVKY
jgi:hypothetical protein